jgi:N-terminal domain of anti-restriction factor ArdC
MAKTKTKRGKTPEQRKAEVDALRARVAEWLEDQPFEVVAQVIAQFDGYSERNAMLIAMQCPTAIDVDGFHAWLQRGRCVRKDEKGIRILAPAGSYLVGEGDEAEECQRFRVTTVFDVSQTEALVAT